MYIYIFVHNKANIKRAFLLINNFYEKRNQFTNNSKINAIQIRKKLRIL